MGNLTRDPELRQTSNGRSVCSFSIATNRRWNNQEGEQQDQVEFHDAVAWGKLAEICAKILYKGRKTYIEGRLQTRSWEGQDGVKRNKTEIVADNVIAVGARREGGPVAQEGSQGVDAEPSDDFDQRPTSEKPKTKADETPKPEKKSEAKKSAPKKDDEEEIDLDDIPF